MPERFKENEPTKKFIVKTMPEIFADLSEKLEMNNAEVEYEIDGYIEATDLKALLDLEFEVAITEQDGKIILTPLATKTPGAEKYIDRMLHSRLSAHTHNRRKDNIIVNGPSLQDAEMATHTDNQTLILVIHGDGITRYKQIARHVFTGESIRSGQLSSMWRDYQISLGVVFDRRYSTPDRPFIDDKYSKDEQARLAREFAEKTGMIISEASWDDKEAIQDMLKIINLKEK